MLTLLGAVGAGACEHQAHLGFACPGPQPECFSTPAADSGSVEVAPPPPAAESGSVDAAVEPLRVVLLDSAGAPVSQAQLACGVDCFDVTAQATGGRPPYSYAWFDAVTAAERRLCPDASAMYTLRVRDSSDLPAVSAELVLNRTSCLSDAGAPITPRNCRRYGVGEYLACGNVGTSGDMPRLIGAQPHTLRVYSNLMTAGGMQVTAVGARCGYSEPLLSFALPTGPSEQTLCLMPSRDTATLMITVTSGGSAAFLTNADSYVELCGGCE